ncbi:unnamed protein product [Callosobruchus maculatus]|nr:unnamed protein product [Callosobruchus maculatus]
MSQRTPQQAYYDESAEAYRYQETYPEMRPRSEADEQDEYGDYDYDQDVADDAYSDDEPSESAQPTAYAGQVSPGAQTTQNYRPSQSAQEAQARYAQSQSQQQQRAAAQPVSTVQAYRQSQPVLPQQPQQQARQPQQFIQQQSHPGLPAQQQAHQASPPPQQPHPGLSAQYYQAQQHQYAQQLQARQLEAQARQEAQRAQQMQLEKQRQVQQMQQAQQMKQAQQIQQAQQLQQSQQAQPTKRMPSAQQLQQLLQMQQAQVQQNQQPQRAQQIQQQQAQYQQQQQAYAPNIQANPNQASKVKSKDNVSDSPVRPQPQAGKKPCPVKQYTAKALSPQQYAQLGDGMQSAQQYAVRKQPGDRQMYVYNADTRPQFPARYLMDGTYAAMTPIKTGSDVAKARPTGVAYPASMIAQSGDTSQKAKTGKMVAYSAAAARAPSPQARAVAVPKTGATYQQQTAAVRPVLQQYEPRRSPPLAVPRQQEQQQRYASAERQGKMSDQWAEEVTQQRVYSKANESRYQSPNMNQYLYTSTN